MQDASITASDLALYRAKKTTIAVSKEARNKSRAAAAPIFERGLRFDSPHQDRSKKIPIPADVTR